MERMFPFNMSLIYIRNYYGVPAEKGMRVKYKGKSGVITGSQGPNVIVKLDGSNHSFPYYPLDLEYKE